MRKFNSKILLFLSPILLISILMEFSLRSIPNDYSYKKEYLDTYSNEIETLILGSSHSYRGINPIYFTNNCFNASYVSQSLNYDYEILRKYDNNFSNLKTVVLSISYFSLFTKMEQGLEAWRVKNYVIYYGINISNSITDFTEIMSNRFGANLQRLVSYYLYSEGNMHCSKFGWGIPNKFENTRNLEGTGKTAAQRHTVKDYKYLKENILTLNSIIEFCKKHNVKLILYTPPAYITYRQNLNKEQLRITLNLTYEIANSNENCSYLNLLEDTSFISTDFLDADHLNEDGAKKLSNLLNAYINDKKGS
jgi:hypothetical protein